MKTKDFYEVQIFFSPNNRAKIVVANAKMLNILVVVNFYGSKNH